MVNNVSEVEKYLAALPVTHKDYVERLAFVKKVQSELANPQNRVPAIHIAGTSGKGSTAYYAASLLKESKYRVGLAVSPHVNSVMERTQLYSNPLSEKEYCVYFNEFLEIILEKGWTLSYIEFLTIFTYWLFEKMSLDYMVIEVGLGGRLDPTNTITRPATIRAITDIGYDHVEILGDTLTEITREKAGIIHEQDIVVIHDQPNEVMNVIHDAVSEKNAILKIAIQSSIEDSQLPVFQQRNWSLAYTAVHVRLALDDRQAIKDQAIHASQQITIPGRYERFVLEDVTIILDAAHNPQKLTALTDSIKISFHDHDVVYIVAFGKNKYASLEDNLSVIRPNARYLFTTNFTAEISEDRRAIDPSVVAETAIKIGYQSSVVNVQDDAYIALEQALGKAKKLSLPIVVTGSFYLIDGIRELLLRSSEKIPIKFT